MTKNLPLFILAFIAFSFNIQAQNGQSDVRFVQESYVNCSGEPVSFIVEVKASSPETEFYMSEQNYRFSFNRDALANPRIAEELTISNFISPLPQTRNLGFTLFSPHNLTGSLDTVVSYNVELAGGDGYYLRSGEDDWVQVGRLEFDVLDSLACVDLVWHPQAVFPPTFVGEIFTENGTDARENTSENFFGDMVDCIPVLCPLPVELVSFFGEERDCKNHLTWETATELNSDYFVIERSTNANQFSELGRVEATGNSLQNTSYSFIDPWAGAEMYYRLKQVDIDNNYAYSDVIKVVSECHADDTGTSIDIFPNPITSESEAFVKLFSNTDETIYIRVMDIRGVLVSETPVSIFNGPNLLRFPTDKLAAGTYFIRIRGNDWLSSTSKFIKLNE